MSKKRINGFSLLELLVVMAILSMLVGIVIPRLNSSDVTVLKAQVREVMAVLKYARRSAIVDGKAKVALFSTGKKTNDHKKTTVGHWVSRGAKVQLGGEIKEITNTIKITFYPEGGSSGGDIILTHLEHKAKITVNPITGKIESEILYE